MLRACVVALSVLAGASVASADDVAPAPPPHADPASAKAAMVDYFAGEKTGGYVLVGMGVGGLVAGGLLFRSSSSSSSQTKRGASYPLLGLGVLHLAAGIYINIASSGRIDKFGGEIDNDSNTWVAREKQRMAGVSTQFTVLKIVEVGLIVGGLTMAGIGWRKRRPRLEGVGIALAIEAALTLGFDIWAAKRAGNYRAELATIDVSARLDPRDDAPTAMITHSCQF